MSEKISKLKKEVTHPEVIARLAAMRACEAAEKELYAKFPPKTKPPITEAVVNAPAPTVPEPTPVTIPEGIDFDEKKAPKESGAVEKPVRRRGKKPEQRQSESVTEAEKPPVVAPDETPVAPRISKSEKTTEGEAAYEGTKLTETIGKTETFNDFYFLVRNFSGSIPQDGYENNRFSGARLVDFLRKREYQLIRLTDKEFAETKLWNDIPSQYGIREKFSELISADRDSYSKVEMRRDDVLPPIENRSERLSSEEAVPVDTPHHTADIDVSGMKNPFNLRRRKGNALAKAQKEMDALAGEADIDESGIPAVFSSRRREKDPLGAVPEQPTEIISAESQGETLYNKIDRLSAEAGELRALYVKEDFDNTTAWKKISSLFRIEKDEKKGEWRTLYEEKIAELQKAEVEMMRGDMAGAGTALSEEDTREGMSKLLRYYKLDERVNLINERTQYRAETQNFSEKIADAFGALGRAYNRLSFGKKILLTGALAGLALSTSVAGGAAGAVAALMALKRVAASAGLAVGVETLLESFGENRRISEADEEVSEQLASLEGTFSETDFSRFEKMLEADIAYSDAKLQQEKRAKTYRKLGAVTLGVAVGSGWLSQIVMEKFGGNEAMDWLKGYFSEIAPDSTGMGAPGSVETPDAPLPSYDTVAMAGAATDTGAQATVEAHTNLIHEFVGQNIQVEKGDSVWKITGELADKLELEGAERTHFIDTLKDQFGEARLRAGETINFSEHGIDQNFVEKALEHSHMLTPEQVHSIELNNLRVTDFAPADPDVPLTDEIEDTLLQGKIDAVTSRDLGTRTDLGAAEAGMSPEAPSPIEITPTATVSPESLVQYNGRVDDWYMQIFRMEDAAPGQDWVFNRETIGAVKLRDILQDAKLFQQGASSGYTTGLDREQITNFAEFFQGVSRNDIGFDRLAFFREHPSATVLDYLNKVAPLVKEGQRIGLYTTGQ